MDGETVEHAFAKPGVFTVELTVTDDSGAANGTQSDELTVVVNSPPVAEAGEDRVLAIGEPALFDASSSVDSDGKIIRYDWDFGDGSRGSGSKVRYAYKSPGTYTVKLDVRDNSPATSGVANDSLRVTVNAPPVAEAGGDQVVTASEVRFNSRGSADPDGTVKSYSWDFGDGTLGKGASPVHVYRRSGKYRVKLTATDDSGAIRNTAVDQTSVIVNQRPIADAGPDLVAAPGEMVTLSALDAFDPDGEIVEFQWDFGDGSSGHGESLEHGYQQPGTYTVRLTVFDNTDDPQALDFDESVVKVNAPPTADAGPDLQAAPGQGIRLNGRGSFDPDGAIVSYSWNLEGRPRLTGPDPVLSFDAPGIYTARLRVVDNSGVANGFAEDEVAIYINHTPAAIAPDDIVSCDGAIRFDGSPSRDPDGQALTFEWDFGDGKTAAGVSPTHLYAAGGVYPVTLTVDDGTGFPNARHSDSMQVTINRKPISEAGADLEACAGEDAIFDGSSSIDPDGGLLLYRWNFGDGSKATGVNPTHVYEKGGAYTVSLEVQDESGLECSVDLDHVVVQVAESPRWADPIGRFAPIHPSILTPLPPLTSTAW